MEFFLGAHQPQWLSDQRFKDVPLFVSARRLRARRSPWPAAVTTWALDSGGFSELNKYNAWQTSPEDYVREVRQWIQIGKMKWAAIQDWMCEEFMLKKTGLSLDEHQRRTVRSWLVLTAAAPEIPWVPVLQGYGLDDYLRCIDLYMAEGCDLRGVVGVGSVCRRQATKEAGVIFRRLAHELPQARLHGFGVKTSGLPRYGQVLGSADSMAWSMDAYRSAPLPECVRAAKEGKIRPHKNCANCATYALKWRERLLAPKAQLDLWSARA